LQQSNREKKPGKQYKNFFRKAHAHKCITTGLLLLFHLTILIGNFNNPHAAPTSKK
jgi:hypothetical protein